MTARSKRARGAGRALWATAVVGALALTGCAEQAGSASDGPAGEDSGSVEGVPFGASMAEYHAAFEEIDPITLHTQSPAPKGSATGYRLEAYLDAVTEWSNGKITFEVAYSNALAAPTDIDNAIADGRLDLGLELPVYEPAEYPANVMLNDVSFVGRQTPLVGIMATHAWMLDVAFQTPAMFEELEAAGSHVLLPAFNSGHSLMVCSEQKTGLQDFRGAQILAGGSTQSKQIEALGGTPVSIPYTEVFESLQRGVADCTVSSLLGVDLGGYAEVANKVTSTPDAGYAITTGNVAINKELWDSLPLEVRQLLFDRLDVFLEGSVLSAWRATASAVHSILDAGGSFAPYDEDATAALQQKNAELLEAARESTAVGDGDAFVAAVESAAARWSEMVENDLGYADVEDFAEFAELIDNNTPDLKPFTAAVFEEILLEHRPE